MPKLEEVDVLLIDDEEELRLRLGKVIMELGYLVKTCASAEEAMQYLESYVPKMVMSDINLEGFSGIHLLNWCQKRNLITRIILITGFVNEHDVHEALKLGCFGFLAKPITKKELKKIVLNALSSDEKHRISDNDYARIEISDFLCGKVLNFPVYIHLSDTRFLKVAHSGMEIDLDRIKELQKKGINELWIESEYLQDYIKLNEKILLSKGNWTPNIKIQLLKHFSEVCFEKIRLCGLSYDTISSGIETLEIMLETLYKLEKTFDITQLIGSGQKRFSAQAILTSTLSALTCQTLEWNSEKVLHSVLLGAYFRDLSLVKMNIDKIPPERSGEDWKFYILHPEESLKILKMYMDVPNEVEMIIRQHHEDGTIEGFPKQIPKSQIFSLARLVNVVDFFVEKFFSPDSYYLHDLDKTSLLLKNKYGNDERGLALLSLLKCKNIKDARSDLKVTMKFSYREKR